MIFNEKFKKKTAILLLLLIFISGIFNPLINIVEGSGVIGPPSVDPPPKPPKPGGSSGGGGGGGEGPSNDNVVVNVEVEVYNNANTVVLDLAKFNLIGLPYEL